MTWRLGGHRYILGPDVGKGLYQVPISPEQDVGRRVRNRDQSSLIVALTRQSIDLVNYSGIPSSPSKWKSDTGC